MSLKPFSDALNTTTISTSTTKKQYAAIQAELGSDVILEQTGILDPDETTRGFLKILDKSAYRGAEYFGVALESGSQILGAGNVFFADPDVNDGADTLPAGQQIVTAATRSPGEKILFTPIAPRATLTAVRVSPSMAATKTLAFSFSTRLGFSRPTSRSPRSNTW